MKQLKETPEPPVRGPRYRYWFTPPETIELPAAFLEPLLPKESRLKPFAPDLRLHLPAGEIFRSNVPRVSLSRLAELLPDYVKGGETLIPLPACRLAAAYALVPHEEAIPEEVTPAPIVENVAEESVAVEPSLTPAPDHPSPETSKTEIAPIAEATRPSQDIPPPPTPEPVALPTQAVSETLATEEPFDPGLKVPPKRRGLFSGMPIFRRKSEALNIPTPPAAPLRTPLPQKGTAPARTIPSAQSPTATSEVQSPDFPQEKAGDPQPPTEIPPPPVSKPLLRETPRAANPPPPTTRTALPPPVRPVPPPPASPSVPPGEPKVTATLLPSDPEPVAPETKSSVPVLETTPVEQKASVPEIAEEEPLQALFLTEEKLTVARVIELCGELPGINSCVLTHGSVVVAAHNAPAHVDLVSLSAHAADMLRAMRESSARMGVGTVPAVTLHTEKGVISFFHRGDLTMLVFHKDRGFVPGVREKMASALGELAKARLTLPAGDGGRNLPGH